jgi:hypothetical protein
MHIAHNSKMEVLSARFETHRASRPFMSTSREVLLRKLRERGHWALAEAAERGDTSPFAAAEYVGIVRRKEPLGTGSENAAKRRTWRIHQVLRAIESENGAAKTLASDEEASCEKSPAPALVDGGYGTLPCMVCANATAILARAEIAEIFLANAAGDGSRRPSPYGSLPRACCRRNAVTLTAAAMIG